MNNLKTLKTINAIFCVGALTVGAFGQGTVNFANGLGLEIRTNATTIGGTTGATIGPIGSYYYGLFIASSAIITIENSLQALLTPTGTFTGAYATNTARAGRLYGDGVITGWMPGMTNTYLILGWSASLGHDWSTI